MTVIEDFKLAFRALSKRAGIGAVVVMTLGIAMAGSVVIFSAIDLAVSGLVPIAQTDRIVFLESTSPQRTQTRIGVSLPDFIDWRAQNSSFEQLGAFRSETANLIGLDEPKRVSVVRASANLLDMWSVRPVSGRSFTPDDDRPSAEPVLLLTDRFWRRQMGADPNIIGRTVKLNDEPRTVIGILLPSMNSGIFLNADVWTVLETHGTLPNRDLRNLTVSGLLKPGVTREQSAADVEIISRRLQREYPLTNAGFGSVVRTTVEAFVSDNGAWLLISILGLMAALLIIVACANVGNVLLAWAIGRRREFLIRMALGSSRWRLIRQLTTEHLLLSLTSAAVGLVLSKWGLDIVRAIAGETSPVFGQMSVNFRTLVFALILSLVTPLLFGIAPVFRALRSDLNEGLRDGVRALGVGRGSLRMQGSLVVSQIGFALILMIGVGLLYRSLSAIDSLEKGIDPDNVLTLRIDLPAARYAAPATAAAFYERLMDGILQSPAVRSVGTINRLPILDRELTSTITIEGQPAARDGQLPWAARAIVSPQYRETMRIPLIQGRDLSREDSADGPRVALISRFMADRYWPGQSAIGKRIRFEEPNTVKAWVEIIGVVGDVRNSDADAGTLPQVYVPSSQNPQRTMAVVIRTERNPEQAFSAVRSAVAALDKDQPIFDVATMERVLHDDLANNFILMGILIALAGIALTLAAAGIYGVIAYTVAQRTAEIGLRMALGATSTTILKMILRRGLALLLIGGSFGLVGGYLLGKLMSGFLYQVAPSDPGTYFSVSALLVIATLAGCCVPAVRAAHVDPMVALKRQS